MASDIVFPRLLLTFAAILPNPFLRILLLFAAILPKPTVIFLAAKKRKKRKIEYNPKENLLNLRNLRIKSM